MAEPVPFFTEFAPYEYDDTANEYRHTYYNYVNNVRGMQYSVDVPNAGEITWMQE